MQPNPTPAVPAEQPPNPKLCAYAACGREFVPTKGHQNYCKPECRQKARNALALDKYHKKRQLLEAGNQKQREEAARIALQTVHDCANCRGVLHELFLKNPAAIELYKRDVEADRADRTIAIQAEKPCECECCHLAPVVGMHGNSKLCIPCRVVHRGESKREGTRQYRSRQRGDAPVEEVRRCKNFKDCGEILEPDPDTGRVHGSKKYCDNCRKKRDLKGKLDWKKNERAEERAKADQVCQGVKIENEWIRQCGLSFVPQKTLLQKYCTTECEVLTNSILPILDPEVRKRRRDNATKMRQRAWRPHDWGEKPEDWRIIGSMLLSQDQISNEDLGKRLDSARIVKCPEKYGNNWAEALSSDQRKNSKRAIDYIWEIRQWVRKPGGSKRKTDAA
jgi:hypothetical protein